MRISMHLSVAFSLGSNLILPPSRMKPGSGGALPSAITALVVSTFSALRPVLLPGVAVPVIPSDLDLTANATCDCHCECEFSAPLAWSTLGLAVIAAVFSLAFGCGIAVDRCSRAVSYKEGTRSPHSGPLAISSGRMGGGKGQITYG